MTVPGKEFKKKDKRDKQGVELQAKTVAQAMIGHWLTVFDVPSLWAVGLWALFGPCVGACIYSVCGTALHVPLFHSQGFPRNFSPDFTCLFLLKGAAREGLGDGDELRGGQFAFEVPPPSVQQPPSGIQRQKAFC